MLRTHRRWFLIGLILLVGTLGWLFQRLDRKPPPVTRHVRIAIPGIQSSALVILAEELGLFRAEGLDVSVLYEKTGKDSLDLVLCGDADLAVAFETPVTHSILEGHPIVVLTELHRSEGNTAILTRRNRTIQAPSDFVGKRIATVAKTNAEFLLDLYLRSHLVSPKSVTIVPLSLERSIEALKTGQVDGVSIWQPYMSQILEENPGQYTVHRSSFYSEFSMLTGLRSQLDADPEFPLAVIRALLKANQFYASKTARARQLVDQVLQRRGTLTAPIAWKQMDIHLGLSATLLTMISEEASWYRSKKGEPLNDLEDTQSILRSRFLSALAPSLVTYE